MRKKISIIALMVIIIVNFSMLLSLKSQSTTLSSLIKFNVANAESGGVPACLKATAWPGQYIQVDANYTCVNDEGIACGEEIECAQTSLNRSGCTQLCCDY